MQGDISQDFQAAKSGAGGEEEHHFKTPLTDVKTYDLRADPHVSTSVISLGRIRQILWQTVGITAKKPFTPPPSPRILNVNVTSI